MNSKNKIMIVSVLNHLQKRDPAWGHVKMLPKFKILYQGWVTECIRHHIHSPEYFSRKWRDGWLSFKEYREFFNYAME